MNPAPVHIGTSGWHYRHWRGVFYPEDLRPAEYLGYYCQRFSSVEINNSFYRLPEITTLADWRDSTPAGFLFSLKASRYLTHMKKLKEPAEGLAVFLERAAVLSEKLAVVLFQLPPRWRCNPERLRGFLELLPKKYRYAFEFRDPSWFNPEVYRILADRNAALCLYDLEGFEAPREITADFIYARLHGPGSAYQGSYDHRRLSAWAGDFSAWRNRGLEVFCYFDNDEAGYAAKNGLELQAMCG